MIQFTKRRRTWFSVSAAACLAAIVLIAAFGFNLGLDFTGGARWVVQFDEPVTTTQVTEFLTAQEGIDVAPKVQNSGDGQVLITIQDMADDAIQIIAGNMQSTLGNFKEVTYQKVDSSIGQSFKEKALIAIAVALIGIILFVAWAFRSVPKSVNPWRFGAVAIVALFHDVLIIAGIFALLGHLLGIELDLPFITALLATLGFSVNDTIVILDRVRENIRMQKPTETFADTVDKSLTETLRRSINTSISTIFPLLALLFFGAGSIFYFVLALALGIVVGTYSSIFLAAPLLYHWKAWSDAQDA